MNRDKLIFRTINHELEYYKRKCNDYRRYILNNEWTEYDNICCKCHTIYDECDVRESIFRCYECYFTPCTQDTCIDCVSNEELESMNICKICNSIECFECNDNGFKICNDCIYDNIEKIKYWYFKHKRNKVLWKIAEYYIAKKYKPDNILKYIDLD